jgi:hypothetical protein
VPPLSPSQTAITGHGCGGSPCGPGGDGGSLNRSGRRSRKSGSGISRAGGGTSSGAAAYRSRSGGCGNVRDSADHRSCPVPLSPLGPNTSDESRLSNSSNTGLNMCLRAFRANGTRSSPVQWTETIGSPGTYVPAAICFTTTSNTSRMPSCIAALTPGGRRRRRPPTPALDAGQCEPSGQSQAPPR